MRLPLLIAPLLLGFAHPGIGTAAGVAQDSTETYRVVLMRAAPGRLLELIESLGERSAVLEAAGEARPLIMRHSQGDQWDLLVLQPVGTLRSYFSAESDARRETAASAAGSSEVAWESRLRESLSWREELFADGPARDILAEYDAGTELYHVEMFLALPGKYEELVEQRLMENRYYALTARRGNLVFTRVAGAAWDVFTIGFYRDLQHFAEDAPVTEEEAEAAAVEAGFEARNRIGTYLRTLMASHQDTLAGAVR